MSSEYPPSIPSQLWNSTAPLRWITSAVGSTAKVLVLMRNTNYLHLARKLKPLLNDTFLVACGIPRGFLLLGVQAPQVLTCFVSL